MAIPPAPAHYFNDAAGLVAAEDAARLDAKLRAFDEQTSTQIVTAIFSELPEPSLEDFTVRRRRRGAWGGRSSTTAPCSSCSSSDRRSRIEVGYGLEGALPDAVCKDILEERLAPAFREGQYARGLESAIDAMIAATRASTRPRRTVPPGPGDSPGMCHRHRSAALLSGSPCSCAAAAGAPTEAAGGGQAEASAAAVGVEGEEEAVSPAEADLSAEAGPGELVIR